MLIPAYENFDLNSLRPKRVHRVVKALPDELVRKSPLMERLREVGAVEVQRVAGNGRDGAELHMDFPTEEAYAAFQEWRSKGDLVAEQYHAAGRGRHSDIEFTMRVFSDPKGTVLLNLLATTLDGARALEGKAKEVERNLQHTLKGVEYLPNHPAAGLTFALTDEFFEDAVIAKTGLKPL